MKLVTCHNYCTSEWTAYDGDLGCQFGAPLGHGVTRPDAITDLCEQLSERAKAPAAPAGVSRLPPASGSGQIIRGPTERERLDMCGPDPVHPEELGL